MDGAQFIHNVNDHSFEELAPYCGQFVAWSRDGKSILAHASTLSGLYAEVDRLGITDYVTDFIPDEDSFIGGGDF